MEFKLTFTEPEVQVLGQALMEIPTKFGMPLLNKIQGQVNEQSKEEKVKEEVNEPVSTVG